MAFLRRRGGVEECSGSFASVLPGASTDFMRQPHATPTRATLRFGDV